MSRILVGLGAVLVALPAAVGVPTTATPVGYTPVVHVGPADKGDSGDDGDERKSATKHRSKHTEDVDVSTLSDEDLAALVVVAEVLVIAAIAASV